MRCAAIVDLETRRVRSRLLQARAHRPSVEMDAIAPGADRVDHQPVALAFVAEVDLLPAVGRDPLGRDAGGIRVEVLPGGGAGALVGQDGSRDQGVGRQVGHDARAAARAPRSSGRATGCRRDPRGSRRRRAARAGSPCCWRPPRRRARNRAVRTRAGRGPPRAWRPWRSPSRSASRSRARRSCPPRRRNPPAPAGRAPGRSARCVRARAGSPDRDPPR